MKNNDKIIGAIVGIILVVCVLIPICTISESGSGTELDVIIIDGQSNGEYGDTFVCDPTVVNNVYDVTPSHNLWYYGTSTAPPNEWWWSHDYNNSWDQYRLYKMYRDNHWIIGGYEPILANSLSERSGNDVLVINMSIGARTIEMLLPDGADAEYTWGVLDRALDLAKERYSKINMAGVVWIQGEGDKDTPVNDYISDFEKLMGAFSEYGANDFYIVHTRDYFGGNANIAQEQLAQMYDNVEIATYITESFTLTNGTLASNADIHYSQIGRNAIALSIADKIVVPDVGPNVSDNGIVKTIIYVIPVISLIGILVYLIRGIVRRS